MIPVSVVLRRAEHRHPPPHARARRLCRRPARHRESGRLTKPEIGQLKNLPKLAVIREFPPRRRWHRGLHRRPEARRDALHRRRRRRRGRRQQGQRLFRTHQAPSLQARSQAPRFRPPPRARLDRPRHHAGPRLQGHAHGRHLGDARATVKKLRVVRADAERNLLLVKGSSPAPQRADPREEGLAMPKTTLYGRTGEAIGEVELPEELFAAPINIAVLHQVVTAQLAGRHLGTHDTKRRGEVSGGGKEAVPSEGHRPGAPGFHSLAAVHRRRRGLRTAPALLRPASAAPDEAPRPVRRPDGQARRRRHSHRRRRSASKDRGPATWSRSSPPSDAPTDAF